MGRTINGTNGANRIEQGRDTEVRIFGKDGNDTIILNRTDDLGGGNFVDAGNGNDSVVNMKEFGNDIRLGDGNDTYVGSGFGSFSTDRADIVKGGAGNDKFVFSTFKSQYFGESGHDTFISVGWQNHFDGGSGNDTLSYEARADEPSLNGVFISLIDGKTQTGNNRFETFVSIENATGSQKDDTIIGSNSANIIKGMNGNDEIDGRAGNDVIEGGLGSDYLLGGSGADRFDFNNKTESVVGGNRDLIDDFRRSQGDKIDLRDMDADSTHSGNQAFSFIGTANFSGDAGELRFKNGIVSGDINGDGRPDFEIAVSDMSSMRGSDFLL